MAFEASLYSCGEDKRLCLVDRTRLAYGLATGVEPTPREISLAYQAAAASK